MQSQDPGLEEAIVHTLQGRITEHSVWLVEKLDLHVMDFIVVAARDKQRCPTKCVKARVYPTQEKSD